MDYNKAIIVGRITTKPELVELKDSKVTNFSVATNHKYKETEKVEFHNITAFGKLAEIITTYMDKGSEILIEGRLQTNSFEKDGTKQYRTNIIAENIQMGKRSEKPSDDLF